MRFSFLKNIYLRELPGGPVLGFLLRAQPRSLVGN